jgi:CubicO group peptidase (beta-lactamase class C family)
LFVIKTGDTVMPQRIISSEFEGASRLLNELIKKKEISGAAVMMAQHNKVLYRDFAGYANIENKQPVGPDTIYKLYSMAKVVTSVALLRLYERGYFHMHQPIGDFLPNYKKQSVIVEYEDGKIELVPAKEPVTMKQLFTMTSGITSPGDDTAARKAMKEIQQKAKGMLTKDFVNEVGKAPLAFHPGEQFMYGFSLDVLAGILEVITGKRFGDYLREEIFDPLGMKDAGYYLTSEQMERTAIIYRVEKGKLTPVPWDEIQSYPLTVRPQHESGGGGIFCTMADYSRFAQMLLNGGTLEGERILGRKTIELMAQDHLTPKQQESFRSSRIGHNQRGCSYGLTVRVRTSTADAGLNISTGEFGWYGMGGCLFSVDPKEDLYTVIMIARHPGGVEWIHYRLLAAIYAGL